MHKKRVRKNTFGGHASFHKPTKKVCSENERNKQETRKKWRAHINVIDGRKPFITPIPKTGENDLHELQGKDNGYNEGTYYLFSKWVNRCQGDSFSSMGARMAPLNSQWLVLRICGTDFLHCWVARMC